MSATEARTMGLREWVQKHQKASIAVAALAVAAVFLFVARPDRPPPVTQLKSAYFTVDDGRTWFADDATQVPPIEHGGKQAVAAYVFAGKDGKPFVGYLERATSPAAAADVARARAEMLAKLKAQAVPIVDNELQGLIQSKLEVKRPGDKTWVRSDDPRATPILNVTAPDGTPATPVHP